MNVWVLVKSETMANALSRPARAPSESLPNQQLATPHRAPGARRGSTTLPTAARSGIWRHFSLSADKSTAHCRL